MTPKRAIDPWMYIKLHELCYKLGFSKEVSISLAVNAVWYCLPYGERANMN
jgi:hypothetical protein